MTGRRCHEKIHHGGMVDALDALIDALSRKARVHVVRIYKCDRCQGWHTTSQPRNVIRDAVESAMARKVLGIKR